MVAIPSADVVLRTFVTAKIHGIRVTAASVEYEGSVTIGQDLMALAGITFGELVHVVNLSTGARWVTYALPGLEGVFELNGGGARLGVIGDECVVMAFGQATWAPGARVVFCDPANNAPRGPGRLYPPGHRP